MGTHFFVHGLINTGVFSAQRYQLSVLVQHVQLHPYINHLK